ncbi:MAG TPA: periplasmic heavy metal sensor [Gemmatimonadales bacterium]|nr:periplasmic heavy metal sensor [Gemmatimonadales bacterium]
MKHLPRLLMGFTLFAATALGAQLPSTPRPGTPGGPESPGNPRAAEDWLAHFLFPPELVMQQQQAIALKPDQRTAITQAIKDFQGKVLDLQWQMQEETQHLADLLNKPVVDQVAALAQVDKLLGVEREVKRAHMGLLIQIKNQLTPAQQGKLSEVRGGS